MLAGHTQALHNGARLSQYEIGSVLGSGGFGITYLARDTALDAPVAIKEYLPTELAVRQSNSRVTAVSSAAVPDFNWGLERFLDEARVLAKFRHPHIVHIFQVFEANDTAYIVMEYAKGESLSSLIQSAGALSEAQTREILLPIMDGLKRVHERGFLHRDIKPGNIILREEGGPALIDFGAARQAIETKSRSITSIVTEGYAPLEQYDPNGNQGPWTDIYALGAVAYKCLTGKTPPAATSRVRNDPFVPLIEATNGQVSREFDSAVRWALAVYEEERPQTIGALVEAFNGATGPQAEPASRAQFPSDVTRLLKKPDAPSARPDNRSIALSKGEGTQVASRFSSRNLLMAAAGVAVLVAVFFGLRVLSSMPSDQKSAEQPQSSTINTTPGKPTPPAQDNVLPPFISGRAAIIDTGTLIVEGHRVVLAGVTGLSGDYAQIFAKTLVEFGGVVRCSIEGKEPAYRCAISVPGGREADLSEMALLNGAAVTNGNADVAQKAKAAMAKAAGRGIWANTISSGN